MMTFWELVSVALLALVFRLGFDSSLVAFFAACVGGVALGVCYALIDIRRESK